MCGPGTPELAEAAVVGGADIVELGFPVSDPLADGPVIRRAGERALAQGMRTAACLECVASTRRHVDVPLIPMTYASLLEAYGYERFAAAAADAGATSLIVTDLPADAEPTLRRVQLVAPTSTDDRIALAAAGDWASPVGWETHPPCHPNGSRTSCSSGRPFNKWSSAQRVAIWVVIPPRRAPRIRGCGRSAGSRAPRSPARVETPRPPSAPAPAARGRETPRRRDASGWRPSAARAPPRAGRTGKPGCPSCECRRRRPCRPSRGRAARAE